MLALWSRAKPLCSKATNPERLAPRGLEIGKFGEALAINPRIAGIPGVSLKMSDPRNVAHDKKVKQEKSHQEKAPGAAKAKKKRAPKDQRAAATGDGSTEANAPEQAAVEQAPGDYEKSQTVLSKLKEMEFHSRANIETLAGLILTIEEELKQKEFSEPIGEVYAAQDGFHSKIAGLIESYGAKCESLKPSV